MPNTEQDAWIGRVLNISRQLAGGPPPGALQSAASVKLKLATARTPAPMRFASVEGRAIWRDAREAVDAQFAGLQKQLQTAGDDALLQIAQQGLPALTKRLGTEMLIALTEVDTVPPERAAEARAKALKAIGDYRQFLQTDGLVRLLDANPFGAEVSIAATLGGALDRLQQAMAGSK